jgi:thioredoxin 1
MTKVIKFYADWCGPCRVYAKVFDKVSEQLKDQVDFKNINIEEDDTGLTKEYDVQSIPTTVIIKNGKTEIRKGRLEEKTLRTLILDE